MTFDITNGTPAFVPELIAPAGFDTSAPSPVDAAPVSAAAAALEGAAPDAPKPRRKLTVAEKIAVLKARIEADTAKIAELESGAETEQRLAGVTVGSVVVVKFGRKFSEEKDTTRFVEAEVIAMKEDGDDTLYKVQYGEGFDAEIATVKGHAITEVRSL